MTESTDTAPTPEPTEYRFDPDHPLSESAGRGYAVSTPDADETTAKATIAAAKGAMPEVASAYTPSGKTRPAAVVAMLGCMPVALGAVLALVWATLWIHDSAFSLLAPENAQKLADSPIGHVVAFFSMGFAAIAALIIALVPALLNAKLSRVGHNRAPWMAGVATGLTALPASVMVFWPFDGASWAPTDFEILCIPISWVFVFVGAVLVPILSALYAASEVAKQHYCETTGTYLAPTASASFEGRWAEDVLRLLQQQDHATLCRIPRGATPEACRVEVVVSSAPGARTAFLEATFHCVRTYVETGKQEAKEQSENWLIYSRRLEPAEVEALAATLTSSASAS